MIRIGVQRQIVTVKVELAADADYYLDQTASWRSPLEHYNAGIEVDGRWWNPDGLFAIGDGDRLDPYVFKRLMSGWSPDRSIKLSRRVSHRSAGADLVFAPVKSVSALWAMTRDDAGLRSTIEACHERAVREAMSLIVRKHCAITRVASPSQPNRVVTGKNHRCPVPTLDEP